MDPIDANQSSAPFTMSATDPYIAPLFSADTPFTHLDPFFEQFIAPLAEDIPAHPHPHSCPPSLIPVPAAEPAPDLQLPRNLSSLPTDPLDLKAEPYPLPARSPLCAPLSPAIPASPAHTHPPIAPRTPARTTLQHTVSSPHICTPLSTLAISSHVPPHPLTASSPAITPTISKRTRSTKRTRLPGTPVTPNIHASTQPILHQLMSLDIMSAFGTQSSDIDNICTKIEKCVEHRARARKLQLRNQLKDDANITSSQREAKVSRLYHNQILEGYREALREVVCAWYKDASSAAGRS